MAEEPENRRLTFIFARQNKLNRLNMKHRTYIEECSRLAPPKQIFVGSTPKTP